MNIAIGWLFILIVTAGPAFSSALGWMGTTWLIVMALLGFSLAHGTARYGWRPMIKFAIVAYIVANAVENLSVITGVPFGFYEHQAVMGTKIFHIPIVVGLSHLAGAYLGWSMGSLLLGFADEDGRRWTVAGIALIGGFVLAGWDITGDAAGATIARAWIYPNGGGFFGVPLSNFIGWIIAGFCYILAGGQFLRKEHIHPQSVGWAIQTPILMLVTISQPALGMLLPDQLVTDPGGHIWHSADLYESATIAGILTVGFASSLALLMIFKHRQAK